MKIRLVDVDSKIPNLALMKISAYHKENGDKVGFDIPDPDKVYASVIFTKNAWKARALQFMFPGIPIDLGGSGIDLNKILPFGIEEMKPDYDLYPSKYSQGFTTRGCIRSCSYCIVPKKEGNIKIEQHPEAFHDDRFDTCMIMDNNLFSAGREWTLSVLEWFKTNKIKYMDHGLDARLLTSEYANLLRDLKLKTGLKFAFDNVKDEPAVLKSIKILERAGFNLKQEVSFYVFTGGFGSDFDDALYRCNRLRELGTNAFVMRYHNRDRRLNKLAKWANRRWAYWSSPYLDISV